MKDRIKLIPFENKPYMFINVPYFKGKFALMVPENITADNGNINFWVNQIKVKWVKIEKDTIICKWISPILNEGNRQLSFSITYKIGIDYIEILLKIKNLGEEKWEGIGEVMSCFQKTQAPDFF